MIYEYYYCSKCNKPLTFKHTPMCNSCQRIFNYTDDRYIVYSKWVRQSTKKYQFDLCKVITGHYPTAANRLPMEQRVRSKIPKESVDEALAIIDTIMSTMLGKRHCKLYLFLKATYPTLTSRIFYGTISFHIAYYYLNLKYFHSDRQFEGSLLIFIYKYLNHWAIRYVREHEYIHEMDVRHFSTERWNHSRKSRKALSEKLSEASMIVMKHIPIE
jgi:hypothetical protein